MECPILKQLETDRKIEWDSWTYFYSSENKSLRGISDRQSKQHAREARKKLDATIQRISLHERSCETCKQAAKAAGQT
jgi:hypothetical protein